MNIRVSLVVLALAALSGSQVSAHHSFAAEFSYAEIGTITGEVIEVVFVNPHARYLIAIKNESGAPRIF